MARALLDINVVIALLDQGHVLHRAATRGGRFATFDQRVGVAVVPAASDANLCVIPCD
jgi:hypothetical protein